MHGEPKCHDPCCKCPAIQPSISDQSAPGSGTRARTPPAALMFQLLATYGYASVPFPMLIAAKECAAISRGNVMEGKEGWKSTSFHFPRTVFASGSPKADAATGDFGGLSGKYSVQVPLTS